MRNKAVVSSMAIVVAATCAISHGCTPEASETSGPVAFANTSDGYYHQASCRVQGDSKKYSQAQLIDQGYKPCPTCHSGIEPVSLPTASPEPEPPSYEQETVAAEQQWKQSQQFVAQPQPQQPRQTLVHTTNKGKKYHKATCRTIKKSNTYESTVAVAIGDGYDACKVCRPPQR